MSEPAILAVGTRDRWRGVEVTDDGEPGMLGVFLLRLLRRYGGLKGVAEKFVSAPWGWRKLPTREARENGWAPWFTPDNEHSHSQFLTWFILDIEGGRLEVFDVVEKQWLEPVRIAPDGSPLNRPDWVPPPPKWLPTRPAVVDVRAARVLEALRKNDLSVERARAIVSAWMRGRVPSEAVGDEWQLWCGEGATCWSAWRLDGQLLWIPDRAYDSYFELVLSTSDCAVGFGTASPEAWVEAALQVGIPRRKAGKAVEALLSAAAAPFSTLPVKVAVEGFFHEEPSGLLDEVKQKLFPPLPQLLPRAHIVEVLPAFSYEELMRRVDSGETPNNVVEDEEGFHPAREFEPPHEWLVHLVQTLSVPVAPRTTPLPERRRRSYWPYDEP
ncbi:hypothetical protein HPC49_18650 [Pyxidicoccus fallax]|uniref:Uncharacterized protein n=1 Tax=Pyxidicoccus fallax TaxID=394095 RepID=A0A848LNV6_9BACT|nr:hypothetical protein [Pyxidicoccus fallax]NMO19381.1 hypothetical protein [Pyxidicoccus fallax]NPC80231.1 hypothetical protein [Pyxidicoccus fallax]